MGANRSLPFFKALISCTDKKTIKWTADAKDAFRKMKEFIEMLPTHTAPIKGRVLVMYLATSTRKHKCNPIGRKAKDTGSDLLRKQGTTRGRVKLPRIRKAHTSSRSHCKKATKALSGSSNQKDKDMEIKKPATTSNVPNSKSTWKLYVDGASSFDGSGIGLMLVSPKGKEYTYALRYQFEATNNEVEYEALLAGLRIAEEIKIKDLLIFIDSQLVANQLKGLFESRQLVIKQYLEKTKEVLRRFDTYSMEHIRRNQNKKSDALSNLAFMTFEHLTKEVLVEVLANRSINNKEVSKITIETGKNWMTPIHEYLLSGLLPEDPKEARKF
ncbi:reverse transcriptase domain-containing protein [Tanacetum coccineum]